MKKCKSPALCECQKLRAQECEIPKILHRRRAGKGQLSSAISVIAALNPNRMLTLASRMLKIHRLDVFVANYSYSSVVGFIPLSFETQRGNEASWTASSPTFQCQQREMSRSFGFGVVSFYSGLEGFVSQF